MTDKINMNIADGPLILMNVKEDAAAIALNLNIANDSSVRAFTLQAGINSSSFGGSTGNGGTQGDQGIPGTDGADGASAYEIAVENGFIGTESEWIASIEGVAGPKGDTGADGSQGIQGEDGDTGPQGIQGIQGIKGDTGPAGADGAGASISVENDGSEVETNVTTLNFKGTAIDSITDPVTGQVDILINAFEDAPEDENFYLRQNGAWVVFTGTVTSQLQPPANLQITVI